MNDDEKYLFDLNGYLVVEGALTPEEVARANEAIDRHAAQIRRRTAEESLAGGSAGLARAFGRGELGGLVEWPEPWCLPFRAMLAHPRLVPYLNALLGPGFRVDHMMCLITMERGAEGHVMHGSSGPGWDPNQYYVVREGRMHNGLTVAAFQLADINPGDGGLAVIPGSHKSNFPCPEKMRRLEQYREHVRQITCKAGDLILFTEAVTHGTLPWTAGHQRRSLLTRYTAGNMAYVPAPPVPAWADERLRAVLEPPYHLRLNRPFLRE